MVLISAGLYVNQVIVPATPPLFVSTPTPTTSPESYVNQAQTYFKDGKIDQAIEAYEKALSSDPTNPNIFVEMARLQVWSGEYEEAITNAQNALVSNPNHPMAHAVQGWALGEMQRYGEAELALKKAISLDPNNALAHAYYAEVLIDQGDYTLIDKAAEESKQALALEKSYETYRARGLVLMNTQNVQEAVDAFRSAIAINKNFPDVHLFLGIAYKTLGDFDLAEESFLAAYALDPKNTVGLIEISRAYFADGRYRQAAQYAEEAVRIEPTNPRLHGEVGINYYKLDEFNRAIPSLRLSVRGGVTEDGQRVEPVILKHDDERSKAYYWYYGFALAKANQCAEAVPVANEILTTVPDDETAVFNANTILEICQENLENPPQVETGAEGEEGDGTVETESSGEDTSEGEEPEATPEE